MNIALGNNFKLRVLSDLNCRSPKSQSHRLSNIVESLRLCTCAVYSHDQHIRISQRLRRGIDAINYSDIGRNSEQLSPVLAPPRFEIWSEYISPRLIHRPLHLHWRVTERKLEVLEPQSVALNFALRQFVDEIPWECVLCHAVVDPFCSWAENIRENSISMSSLKCQGKLNG